ncbi:MAG: hypothetical protein ACRDQU_00915 [Pseudonocardiaceae bacterium]
MGAIPVHHTATVDTPWDGPAAVAAMPNEADVLRYCHAYVDSSGDPDAKDSYTDPHHKTKGGPANLPACRSGLAYLSKTDIADKTGVKAHLEAHLNDGDPDRETKSAAGGHRKERTAAVARTVTIDELEAGTELELEGAHKRRTKMKLEIAGILNAARSEGRPNLTIEEQTRVDELFLSRDAAAADIDGIKMRLANVKKLRAEEIAGEQEMRSVEPSGAKRPAYDEVARVSREERTYHAGIDRKGSLFMQDVIAQHLFNDNQAATRLARHMHEETVERSSYVTRAVGTGSITGLVVPQYLTDLYAPAIAPMRPFADVCNHHDLPESGMTVNISRITTPTAVALQPTGENNAVVNQDAGDTLLTINIQTAAGQQTLSRQAAERGTGIEEVLIDDLFRRYATALDSSLINQASTGLAAVAQLVSYTDAAPTGPKCWPKLLQAASNSEAALLGFARPDVCIMHSRRWYWLQSQLSTQWPLFGQPGITDVHGGENYGVKYGQGYRGMMPNGMAAVVDNNCATNLGAGTNQDEIYVVATDECHLWEDPNSPVFLRCEQPAAASLGILLVLYGYYCFTAARYTNAMSRISGTGTISPTF